MFFSLWRYSCVLGASIPSVATMTDHGRDEEITDKPFKNQLAVEQVLLVCLGQIHSWVTVALHHLKQGSNVTLILLPAYFEILTVIHIFTLQALC